MTAKVDPTKPLNFLRRERGLFVFDMDSTLIDGEGVDEFARERGIYDEVAKITEAAMRGEMDFDESLRRRIAKLKGLTLADVDRVYDRIPLMVGALDLIGELKLMGHAIGIISGGFDLLAERYARDIGGADALVMNQLEMVDGVATGHVVPPIVNAEEKAKALVLVAAELEIPLSHTVAIGDGANDVPMLSRAGFGIAFRGKPKLREVAKACIDEKNLKKVLELL
ncbi:MAG: phosphoserine phosphatase SerB [Bdellovibrionales bacterium]|nr:phosphoserine phosphatase SerB [Bdellovibrionales bacterium]